MQEKRLKARCTKRDFRAWQLAQYLCNEAANKQSSPVCLWASKQMLFQSPLSSTLSLVSDLNWCRSPQGKQDEKVHRYEDEPEMQTHLGVKNVNKIKNY